MPKISIIVPVYNVEAYIEQCLNSILNQTFTDFECILVDDGSPDNCGAICDKIAKEDNRFHVIHQKNAGQATARNRAIDYVIDNGDSDWIVFIDSDDSVHKQYLEILYKTAKRCNVDIAMCGFKQVRDNDRKEDYTIKTDDLKFACFPPDCFYKNTRISSWMILSSPWNKIFKKELFIEIRFPDGKVFEDEAIMYKLLFSCKKIAFVNEPLYYYFVNNNGTMASGDNGHKIRCMFESLIGNCEFFEANGFNDSLSRYFRRTCRYIDGYYNKYASSKDLEIAELVQSYKCNLKSLKRKYRKHIPGLRKYGYKLWKNGIEDKMDQFKRDIINVRNDKGFFRSCLFAAKNFPLR